MAAKLETVFRGEADGLDVRVPVAHLLTPEHFERERERIFRRSWLFIGREVDAPDPGSWFVRDFPLLKTSLLIMRGDDGVVRAFHNLCTHRGNKLVREGKGCGRFVTCGFHGWSFANDGTLGTITDEHQFRQLDKSQLDLRAIHTETWNGLIFVNFDREPICGLREWLGPLADQYDGYFTQHKRAGILKVDLNANWNLAVNAFIEGYHTKYVHKNSVPDYQGGRINPQRHRPFMELLDRHERYSAPSNPDHKISPCEAVAWRWGRKCIAAFDNDMTGMPPGINPARVEHWAFDILHIFPNIVMALGNHRHMEMQYWPLDENRTVFTGTVYMYEPKDLAERISQEFVLSRGRQVILEDLNTLEAQHEMLGSGALSHLQLSQQEIAVQHHYKVAGEMLGNA